MNFIFKAINLYFLYKNGISFYIKNIYCLKTSLKKKIFDPNKTDSS